MRLTGILLLAGFLQVGAHGRAQTVTYTARAVPLPQVFAAIEQQTGYVFFYDKAWLEGTRPVTVEMKAEPLRQALEQVLDGQPIGFEIREGNTIVLTKRTAPLIAVAMSINIHGRVTDSLGNPLAGASVTVKGGKKGVQTNADGTFTIMEVDGNARLIVSFTGYEPKEVKINGKTEVFIQLRRYETSLRDVVVNKGYYTTTQRLNTGDVTKVTGEDINKQPVSDPLLALEGRVPGLYISQTSGMPGASYTVMLRGKNSIANGNNPLYIVDGVPFTATSMTSRYIDAGAVNVPQSTLNDAGSGLSPFNSLNPADIESIEVLKDADATAIYGSRGANGVILITTKKGKAGPGKIDINVFSGVGKVTRMYKLLNTQQYLAMRHEAFYNDSIENPAAGIKPDPNYDYDITGAWDTTRYNDWQKVMIGGAAHFTNAQASLSGGTTNTQYVLAGGFSRQTTVFPGDYYDQKASVHTNINHVSSSQKFRALFTADFTNGVNALPDADYTGYVNLAPDAPILYNADGSLNWQGGTFFNPLVFSLTKAKATTDNLISNLSLGYEVLPGLQLKSNFGYTHIQMNQTTQIPGDIAYGPPNPNYRRNSFATSNTYTWIIEPQINYSRKLGRGKLDVLIGSTIQRDLKNSIGEVATGFLNDALISNVAAASTIQITGDASTDYRSNALFGKIGYNWQDKYVLNITARRDGSSRFGPGKQFGDFGAIGAAWIFSKEKWAQDGLPFLSFGKLRGSYGTTGNDQITDYQYLSSYSPYSSSTYLGVIPLNPTRLANPYFGWELVKKIEGGLDLGWLKDRIIFKASYYRNRSNNQLIGYALPSLAGFTSIEANLPATVQNSGVELELNTINIRTKDFVWSSSINVSIPRNKLIAYPNLASSPYSYQYEIGKSLFIVPYYHYTGIDPQTGLYTFQDVNKDGIIDYKDLQFTKQVTQNYFGGIQNSFSYKGLQLDILFQFVKQTGINYLSYLGNFAGGFSIYGSNMPTFVLDRWRKPGDIAQVEKFSQGSGAVEDAANNLGSSDALISDASFIRLKNLALSYNLPRSWQQKAHLQNARIYLQCQNLLTITSFKGLDPESGQKSLPPLRMITAGIQFGF